jgi:hypothetical protein
MFKKILIVIGAIVGTAVITGLSEIFILGVKSQEISLMVHNIIIMTWGGAVVELIIKKL